MISFFAYLHFQTLSPFTKEYPSSSAPFPQFKRVAEAVSCLVRLATVWAVNSKFNHSYSTSYSSVPSLHSTLEAGLPASLPQVTTHIRAPYKMLSISLGAPGS